MCLVYNGAVHYNYLRPPNSKIGVDSDSIEVMFVCTGNKVEYCYKSGDDDDPCQVNLSIIEDVRPISAD